MNKKISYYILALAFVVTWIWAAIEPIHYADWVLENILVGIFIVLILATSRFFTFRSFPMC